MATFPGRLIRPLLWSAKEDTGQVSRLLNEGHMKLVEDIAPALAILNIVVYSVQHNRTMRDIRQR